MTTRGSLFDTWVFSILASSYSPVLSIGGPVTGVFIAISCIDEKLRRTWDIP